MTLEKQHTRDYSLFKLSVWMESDVVLMKQRIGVPILNTFFNNNGNFTDIYYEPNELNAAFTAIEKLSTSSDIVAKWNEEYLALFAELQPYLSGTSRILDKQTFRQFSDKYGKMWNLLEILFALPNLTNVQKSDRELAIKSRKLTQHLTEADAVIMETLKHLWPNKPEDSLKVMLPKELFGEVNIGNDEIAKRIKGYSFFRQQIFTGKQKTSLATSLGLEFEDDNVLIITEIKGRIAFPGKATGAAKILMTPKDVSKLNNGEILVAPMTTPDFLPAMLKAAAIITDEGGITCHAAIVAREIGKPCIIGTKIATKVLKDGDIVEVDAENNIVRIIK